MRRFLCFLALLLHIVTWVPVTSRLLAPIHQPSSQQQGNKITTPEGSQTPYMLKQETEENAEKSSMGRYGRGVQLGSRPPSCEHKCDGCIPCMAIQVPTITSHFGVQYANYEPESWKCKCGPSFYSP